MAPRGRAPWWPRICGNPVLAVNQGSTGTGPVVAGRVNRILTKQELQAFSFLVFAALRLGVRSALASPGID